jgi:hypothetical protein
MITEFV